MTSVAKAPSSASSWRAAVAGQPKKGAFLQWIKLSVAALLLYLSHYSYKSFTEIVEQQIINDEKQVVVESHPLGGDEPTTTTKEAEISAHHAANETRQQNEPSDDTFAANARRVTWPMLQAKLKSSSPRHTDDACSDRAGYNFLNKWKRAPVVELCKLKPGDDRSTSSSSAQVRTMNEIWLDSTQQAVFVEMTNVQARMENGKIAITLSCLENTETFSGVQSLLSDHEYKQITFRNNGDYAQLCRNDNEESSSTTHLDLGMLFYRYDANNIYHGFESVMGAMEAALMANIDDPNQMPIFFADAGPRYEAIDDLYTAVFGNNHVRSTPLSPHLLKEHTAQNKICFSRLIIGFSSRRGSVIPSTWSRNTPCAPPAGNLMTQDLANYVLSRLGLEDVTPPPLLGGGGGGGGTSGDDEVVQVLWLDRRDSRPRQVEMKSLEQIKKDLEQHTKPKIQFTIWNPQGASLTEQITKVRSAHIIMGVHGAALVLLAFQPPAATGAIELRPRGHRDMNTRSVAHIFRNLAVWFNRPFSQVTTTVDFSSRVPQTLDRRHIERITGEILSMAGNLLKKK